MLKHITRAAGTNTEVFRLGALRCYSTEAPSSKPANSVANTNTSTDINSTPPSFFHNETNLPKKIEELHGTSHAISKLNEESTRAVATTIQTTASQPAGVVAPRSIFSTDHSGNGNGGSDKDNNISYFQSYRDFCMGMAYLGVGTGVVYLLFDQHERLDESERQMNMMKKKQKDVAVQLQNYKVKLNKISVEKAKKSVLLQGKMQMHIAMLRKQLTDAGMDPIDIESAIHQFESDVKIDISANTVELWVPGDKEIKKYIPDPHEYSQRR